jgi:hypothetical protein
MPMPSPTTFSPLPEALGGLPARSQNWITLNDQTFLCIADVFYDDGLNKNSRSESTSGVPTIAAVLWAGSLRPTLKVGDVVNANLRLAGDGDKVIRGYSMKVASLQRVGNDNDLQVLRLVGPFGSVRV